MFRFGSRILARNSAGHRSSIRRIASFTRGKSSGYAKKVSPFAGAAVLAAGLYYMPTSELHENEKEDLPNHVGNTFPYQEESRKELNNTFKYNGTFSIVVGPTEFNRVSFIRNYLFEENAKVIRIKPRTYLKSTTTAMYQTQGSRLELLLRKTIKEYNNAMKDGKENLKVSSSSRTQPESVFTELTNLVRNRGPGKDHYIWINHFEEIFKYIDSIEDPEEKKIEEAVLSRLLLWLEEISLDYKWSQVLIQSSDPTFISRLENYMPQCRSNAELSFVCLGERSKEESKELLSNLLLINDLCMKPEDIEVVVKQVGGSGPVLANVVKRLLAGSTIEHILADEIRPLVIQLEAKLLSSPYRIALWDLVNILVENYQKTGQLHISSRVVNYSPTANVQFQDLWNELQNLLFYFEVPTAEIKKNESQESRLPSGYIAASSIRAMTALEKVVSHPDMKRVMWNDKKKSKDPISFFQ